MRKFKHKKTGDIAELVSNSGYKLNQSTVGLIPQEYVENSSDWEEIKETPRFKHGDKVYRVWESGVKTLGIITDDYRFEALESYEDEGGVIAGEIYGLGGLKYELVKKETPEEAAESLFPFTENDSENRTITIKRLYWIEGAKWKAQRSISIDAYEDYLNMQRASNAEYESKINELKQQIEGKYSEEEVRNIANWAFGFYREKDLSDSELEDEFNRILEEKFKKK
jgi:hypothetical protein